MKNLPRFLFIITILLFISNEIQASCPLRVQEPPCVEFYRADAVFVASATEVQVKPQRFGGVPPPIVAQLKVEEIFKGIKEKEIVLDLDHCGYQFREGEKYLIYAHRQNDKLNVRIGNTRTKPIAEAADELDFLRSLQRDEPQAQIVGKIGQKTAEIKKNKNSFSNIDWTFFGAPMPGIKVFAKRGDQTYETFSDAKGEYKFSGLTAGEYEIWADYPSYFESRKQTVRTVTQGCGVGNITAWRKGSISGRVMDADGAAISKLLISLVPANAAPEEILEEKENESVWHLTGTDEKGEYSFVNLPAGRYFVVINRTKFEQTRGNERLQKIPRLFFPGVSDIEKAQVISIEEGEQVKRKDFHLPKNISLH